MSRLSKVRMTLARTAGFPEGSARHGYEFVAPLDDQGRIDPAGWRDHKALCVVHRFWGDEKPETGHLIHRAGGAAGATWIFDYDGSAESDDEAGFRFQDHAFRPGEYVSLRDGDGEMHTFKVATVTPA
jgi:hypothetical protein